MRIVNVEVHPSMKLVIFLRNVHRVVLHWLPHYHMRMHFHRDSLNEMRDLLILNLSKLLFL